MKNLVFAGVATTALLFAISPAQASDSFGKAIGSGTENPVIANTKADGAARNNGGMRGGNYGNRGGGHMVRTPNVRGHNVYSGRWHGGMRAPGGYAAYRRPVRGFILPSYWINPGFSINNYAVYGLRAPSNGYYWSRYYDDAVMTNSRGYVYDSVPNVNWAPVPAGYAPQGGYQQADYGPAINPDQSVYGWGENADDPRIGGTTEAGTYEGEWTGRYIDNEGRTYRGQWEGQYTNEEGRVYEGTYRGTMTGDPVYRAGTGSAPGAPYPAQDYRPPVQQAYPQQSYPAPVAQPYPARNYPVQSRYSVPSGYERYEQCLKGRGLTGGAIGAVLGAVAGNRIAGRGDRLAGSLIGGGIGAIAGVGIEKATNKCSKYLPQQQYQPAPQVYYPPQPQPQAYYPAQQPYAYGWQGGYYYPQPQQTVTTITVIPGSTVTTTETVEEVVYEDVYTAPRAPARKGKGLRRPAPTTKSCRC